MPKLIRLHPMRSMLFQRKAVYTTQTTFYRRDLPNTLHSFTSDRGKELFKKAVLNGEANIFFPLSGNFIMQSEPAFCGLGSLAMVLNALSIDPGRRWKGVWRWYSDDMLECCASLETVKKEGLTFQQLASTGRGNGLTVTAKQGDHVSYEEFKRDLEMVTKSEDKHMIVSFCRKTLGQTGEGHFSPIGAFVVEDNQVLVMDTARFKYPSYFVDARLLYDAMMPIDISTGLPRGYLLLSTGKSKPLPLCRITAQRLEWEALTNLFWTILPERLHNINDFKQAVNIILTSIPHKYHFFTSLETSGFDLAGSQEKKLQLTTDLRNEITQLLEETNKHQLFSIVKEASIDCISCEQEIKLDDPELLHSLATLFLLSMPRELLTRLPTDLARKFIGIRDAGLMDHLPLLKEEVERMSMQWNSMLESYCACGMKNCSKKSLI